MTRPTLPPRFPATPDQINAQVRAFYARVREDTVLGPVFNKHVHDWPAHEDKIAAFWRNAILFERSYDGNPQRVHIERPDVKPEFFAHWLDLFEEVATQTLPPGNGHSVGRTGPPHRRGHEGRCAIRAPAQGRAPILR